MKTLLRKFLFIYLITLSICNDTCGKEHLEFHGHSCTNGGKEAYVKIRQTGFEPFFTDCAGCSDKYHKLVSMKELNCIKTKQLLGVEKTFLLQHYSKKLHPNREYHFRFSTGYWSSDRIAEPVMIFKEFICKG